MSEQETLAVDIWDFRVLPCECPFSLKKSALVLNCAVEQRLARQAHNLEVVGSIPTGATERSIISSPQLNPEFHEGFSFLRRSETGVLESVWRS